jgi:PAS domain S-box-containing protein
MKSKNRGLANTLAVLLVIFCVTLFSTSDLLEMFPFFNPFTSSPIFPYFHDAQNLIALTLVLWAAYRYSANIGILSLTVYLALHIPYVTSDITGKAGEVARIIFTTVIGFAGIWAINLRKHTEEDMAQINAELETAQKLTKIGNWQWDITTAKVTWSKGLCLILKWDPEKPTPPFAEMSPFYTLESWTRLNEAVTKCLANGVPYDLELDQIRTDGTRINTQTRGEAEFGVKGTIIGLHGTVQDITDIKESEKQISHLANMLRTIRSVDQLITREKDKKQLIQKSCDLLLERQLLEKVWIMLFDTNGNIVAGGTKLPTREFSAFLEQLKAGHYPECVIQVLSPGTRFMTFQQPGKIHPECIMSADHTGKDTFRCKLEYDGRTYGVIGISGPAGTAFDIDERDLFIELCDDISFALDSMRQETERKEAEEAHRLSEENYRHSVDESPLGIRILDKQGKTVYTNRAVLEMFGLKHFDELNTTPSSKFYTPEAYAEHRNRVEKRNRGEYLPPRYQISIIRPDGSVRYLDVFRAEVIWNGVPQFQQLYQDITETKNLQEQLIMQDRLVSIGQLVSGVAHELNNPLTSVIGFSELLLQRQLPNDIRADVNIINEEAKRTSTIVKNLLTFARQQPQDKHPIQINEPIQSVLLLRNHEQTVNNIRVHTVFATDLPLVMANASQLQQVFFNLVTNAEFAMTEAHSQGTLTISSEKAGDFVRVSITDDGSGIAPEIMRRLFSPFFTTKELGKGTGLGLSICQGIVTEHGGKIWAESEPGKGTTFKVELPVYVMPGPGNDTI